MITMDFEGPVPADLAAVETESFLSDLIAGFAAESGEGLIPVADDGVLFILMEVKLLHLPGAMFFSGFGVAFGFTGKPDGVFRGVSGGFVGAVALFASWIMSTSG